MFPILPLIATRAISVTSGNGYTHLVTVVKGGLGL